MSDFIKFNELIKIIPDLLIYFVPGFIFITIRNYDLSIDCEKDKYIGLKSIVGSYIVVQGINMFYDSNRYYFTLIVILFTIIASILYVKFKLENKILEFFGFDGSTNNDWMRNIIDTKKGAWVYAYIEKENVIYCGKLIYYHTLPDRKEMMIVLSNYALYSYECQELDSFLEDNTRNIVINTKDITRIEIVK